MITVAIKVNVPALRQPFHPCTLDFIRDICQARCCRSTTDPTGIAVIVTSAEAVALRRRGAVVDDRGRVQPVNRRCPFQGVGDHLCTLHAHPDKPGGCIISPFTINDSNTLIVRNRYRMLPCFKADGAVPVAHAHRASLERLFGEAQATRLVALVDVGWTGAAYPLVDADDLAALRHKNSASKSK
jgi:hypothetical protein